MGRYTTWSLICARYPDAAKKGGSEEMETAFITGAEAQLDGIFGVRYTVPFTPAPPSVTDLATDLVWYRMTRLQKTSAQLGIDLQKTFDAIIKGNFTVIQSGASLDGSKMSWVQNSYYSHFGPDDPVNWQVSSQETQDARDARGQTW